MKRWARVVFQAAQAWLEDNAFKHAAAVSFYTLFSLAPVMIIAVTVAGFVFGEEAARGQLSEQLDQLVGHDGAELVEHAVAASQPDSRSRWSAILGIAVMIIGATTVFAQLQESLNQIWGVVAKPSRNGFIVLLVRRLISLAMVLTVGFLLLVSLVLTTALTAALKMAGEYAPVPPFVLRTADIGLALLVITVLFALI
ncbi:MAG TPA: YhjD/YihY/BrkB family envelope integrity protein, partial [Candidatus Synoicihabitans sp.]|nr:YhjD/YihY/BrkB family envelope integrity protein [Candidatus Synoicihabitans sp.]